MLDRPNPLGGDDVSGFVLEPRQRSFVGQYPIPIVHGLTVGELARMIKGERWLDGLGELDLQVVPVHGLAALDALAGDGAAVGRDQSRTFRRFEAALVYPGIGIVGETLVNEGRGTPTPFPQFGAPWLDARASSRPNSMRPAAGRALRGRPLSRRARSPTSPPIRVSRRAVNACASASPNRRRIAPLEIGMHVLARLREAAPSARTPLLEKLAMFHKIAGTTRLVRTCSTRAPTAAQSSPPGKAKSPASPTCGRDTFSIETIVPQGPALRAGHRSVMHQTNCGNPAFDRIAARIYARWVNARLNRDAGLGGARARTTGAGFSS